MSNAKLPKMTPSNRECRSQFPDRAYCNMAPGNRGRRPPELGAHAPSQPPEQRLRDRTSLKADFRLGGHFLRSLKAGPILHCEAF